MTCAGPGTIGVFKREFGKNAKVWDKNKIVIIPDHYIFTADSLSNRNVDILRDFVREQGLPYFYDVIDDPNGHWIFDQSRGQLKKQFGSRYAGVCHTALPAKGHTRPGEILFGTDSHTCMAGAFNMFATGIGNTDAGFILGTGKLLIKVPPTMRFKLEGRMPRGVMAKDVILHVIGLIGFDGATYKAMQYEGSGVYEMNMDDRMTIANMAIEAGGKNGVFPCDDKTVAYVNERTERNGTKSYFEPVELDDDQDLVYDALIDLDELEPTVAQHPDPGNRALAKELEKIQLDRAYIGSFVHRRQDLGFPRLRGNPQGPQRQDRHLRRARHARCRLRPAEHDDQWHIGLGLAGIRRRADDRERLVRGLPRRPGRHLRPHEQAARLHLRHEPELPRPHGPQGIQGLPRLALHGRGLGVDRGTSPIRGSISKCSGGL